MQHTFYVAYSATELQPSPWLVTKRYFIMLALIILGRRSVIGDHFDMYLEPLLEELRFLWTTGVLARDAPNYGGQAAF
jgi:hypothetical protein